MLKSNTTKIWKPILVLHVGRCGSGTRTPNMSSEIDEDIRLCVENVNASFCVRL